MPDGSTLTTQGGHQREAQLLQRNGQAVPVRHRNGARAAEGERALPGVNLRVRWVGAGDVQREFNLLPIDGIT